MNIDPQKVINVDDDEESDDCNNRICFLRSLRFCDLHAKLCRQKCRACQRHGSERDKMDHKKVPVDVFETAFSQLEKSCSRETEHYIRQMNQTQKKAVEAIARKKQEYFKEIEDIKIHLMKKTYKDLDQKYPTLYEKYKNNRLDTLKCCEVFWVLNTIPSPHPIKHSEINKKLQAILKKFEAFKEVARNVRNDNMFDLKEKVKKGKIAEKSQNLPKKIMEQPEPLERVGYNKEVESRYVGEIDKLSRQLLLLKEKKKVFEEELRELQHQVKYFTLKKQKMLALNSKTVNFRSPPQQEDLIIDENDEPNFPNAEEKENIQKVDIEIELNPSQQDGRVGDQLGQPPQNLVEEQAENIVNEPAQEEKGNEELDHEAILDQIEALDENKKKEKENAAQGQVQEDEQKHLGATAVKEKNIKMTGSYLMLSQQQHHEDRPQLQNQPAINEVQIKQKEPLLKPQLAAPEEDVKIEAREEVFQSWKNSQLLQEMRNSGGRPETGLKVQYIDVLSGLPSLPLPKHYGKEKEGKRSEDSKPNLFTAIADKLFLKFGEGKKSQQKDKQQ